MARLARLALVPLTLAAAAPAVAPTVAQADSGVGQQSAGVLGSVAGLKLYPLAGSHVDPLSNVVGTSIGGIPVSTQPVADAFSDGMPVKDLPLITGLVNNGAAPAAAAVPAAADAAAPAVAADAVPAPAAAPAS